MMENTLKISVDNSEVITLLNEVKELLLESSKKEKLIYTTEELSEILGYSNSTDKVNELRRSGAIKAIKKGQGYIFTRKSVVEFLEAYDGQDISNTKAIKLAVSKIKKRESHQETRFI